MLGILSIRDMVLIEAVDLRFAPGLNVLTGETGAGKTEAAVLLAQRMLLAGKGRGLYLALPTMATANAMFGRARRVVRRMKPPAPTFTLRQT